MKAHSFRTTLTLLLLAGSLLGRAAPKPASVAWQKILQQRLALYGHRNWIIVTDAAFPAYSQSGIETITVDEDLPSVLKYVTQAISSSRHVQASPFLDKGLQFVQEKEYPGVERLREEITRTLGGSKPSTILHSEVLSKIDDAGKTFRVLFIKTNSTIPYTCVYIRLACGYMTNEIDKKIRSAVVSER